MNATQTERTTLVKWLHLGLGIGAFWLFAFVICPALNNIPEVKTFTQYVQESGINASGLYYTEIEETAAAEFHSRHTFRFMPTGPHK